MDRRAAWVIGIIFGGLVFCLFGFLMVLTLALGSSSRKSSLSSGDRAGVEMRTITAGKLQASGSPFRDMTPEERAYFEGVLHDVHEQFIQAVADGRKLKPEDVRPSADGRVFTGRQAKELKLVDELGGF